MNSPLHPVDSTAPAASAACAGGGQDRLPAPPTSRWRLYLNLIRWDRPAGWLLLLWPTLTALWWAAGGWPGWHLLVVFVGGTVLMRSAGCCVNDVADRHFDRHVKRTASRPVTSGAVSVREALSLGAVLALMALALVLTTNGATVVWAVGALLVTIAYPYAKRWVSMPQAVLGLAFSFGIPMAFTAVQAGPLWALWQSDGLNGLFSGDAVVTAWQATPATVGWLLLGNVCWVLAYDTEYAMVDRDDDLKIGMKTSAITLGRWDVPAVMLFYMGCLLFTALPLYLDGIHALFFVSLLPAAVQIVWHYRLIRTRQREGCFRAFRANHWLGLTLFAGVVLALWVARGL